jgi:hypothetical protein
MKIIRVNKSDQYDIFIGRPSKFSNPFIVGKDGTRSEVIQKFKDYFRSLPNLPELLKELEGKRIACWCSLDSECHGDVIIALYLERQKHNLIADSFDI